MAEWINLTSGKEVFDRQAEGWEIEAYEGIGQWRPWRGSLWTIGVNYRGRPKQPKTRTIKLLAYYDSVMLIHVRDSHPPATGWLRVPAEDKVIEVKA